jgi:hypothetical protein
MIGNGDIGGTYDAQSLRKCMTSISRTCGTRNVADIKNFKMQQTTKEKSNTLKQLTKSTYIQTNIVFWC